VKPKELLKNEWVKTGIMLGIVVIAFFAFWFGIRLALATEYPLLAVASPSMVPTLNVGDLIVVHGISNASEVYTHYENGDIIIFHTNIPGVGPNLWPGRPEELIVHRAVEKTVKFDSYVGRNVTYFTTKGDNNAIADTWPGTGDGVPEYYIVGKVVGTIPWIGNIPLYIRTTEGIITVVILVILVFFAEFAYSALKEKQKPLPVSASQR
jgi:signal peptidase I